MGVDAFNSPNYLPGVSGSFQPSCIIYGTGQTYLVTYDGSGSTGGSVPSDGNSYSQGASVTVKANTGSLVKSGYNFVGWATTSNASAPEFAVNGSNVNPPSFNMPASNVTLYAVWHQIAPCTLTYNGNGHTSGSAPTDSNSPYTSGSTVTVKGNTGNLEKTGHTFLGWSTNSSAQTAQYTQGQTFTINTNTTLYAVWQPTGGGGFDGGTINNPLEIKCKFPTLNKIWIDVLNWINNAPDPTSYDAYLRFTNKNPSPALSTDIYGVAFKDGSNYEAGIGINDSLFVRSKLYAKEAGIGELTVPTKLYTDKIENFEPASNYLTIKPNSGKTIKLDGDVLITGTLSGGGSNSSGINIFPNSIFLKTTPKELDPFDMVRKVWGFSNGVWDVPEIDDETRGTSWISLTNDEPPTSVPGVNLFLIHTAEPSPLLMVDRGMLVKKDFTAGGYLAANQGALYLGSGLNYQTDIPKIILRNAWLPRLGDDNYTEMGAPAIPKYATPPSNPAKFQMYIRTTAYGNNPPNTVYKWNPKTAIWDPMGLSSSYGNFDTLYIRKMLFEEGAITANDDEPGHLDVGNITIHGTLSNIQAGESSTVNVTVSGVTKATRTIKFLKEFRKIPSVTFSIRDVKEANGQYQDKHRYGRITEVTTKQFTIETYTIEHMHKIGWASGTAGPTIPSLTSAAVARQLSLCTGVDPNTGDPTDTSVGATIEASSNVKTLEFWTGNVRAHQPAAAYFYWQAIEQTQYTAETGPNAGQEMPR